MSGSDLQNKTAYELEKLRLRFNGWRGQMQGAAHSLPSDWIPEAEGTYAYPKPLKGNNEDSQSSS